MSDTEQQLNLGDEEQELASPKRSKALFWLFVAPLTTLACVIALSYLVRTQPVTGPLLQEVVAAQGARLGPGFKLSIDAVRPWGLSQLRLDDVKLSLQRGEHVVDAHIKALDLSVDWIASVKQKRLVPGTLLLHDAKIVLKRGQRRLAKTPSKKSSPTLSKGSLPGLHIEGHNVQIELQAGNAYTSTRPIEWTRFELDLSLLNSPRPTHLDGYGTLPDGAAFSVKTTIPPESSKARRFEFKAARPTRIDQWFENQVPFEVTTERFALCVGCAGDVIEMSPIALKLPNLGQGFEVAAPEANVVWVDQAAKLALSEFALRPLNDRDPLMRLTESVFAVDLATGKHSGRLGFYDTHNGSATIDWQWDSKSFVFGHEITAKQFSLTPLLHLLDVDSTIESATLNGTSYVEVDLDDRLVEARVNMQARDLRVHLDAISKQMLHFPLVDLRANAMADLAGRSLSITEGEVGLQGVSPLKFEGHLIDANTGWRFETKVQANQLDASALQEALPTQVLEPVLGAKMRGFFDVALNAQGHSAFPDSLSLNLEFKGDVEVLRDGPRADIQALAANGVPWVGVSESQLFLPTKMAEWIPIDQMPPHIPRVLTAAEDAVFFKHNGFDFKGLERAMRHNLRVRRMERGGSTITQQLIKNLYLSRQRTLVRKVQEAYLTWRIEQTLSKSRILEIYINMVHWGPKLYGLKRAATYYFGKEPEALSVVEMALLSTLLPNPERFGRQLKQGVLSTSRLTKFEHILSNLRWLEIISPAEYSRTMKRAAQGEIGQLSLSLCRDDSSSEWQSVKTPCHLLVPKLPPAAAP